MTDPTEYVVAVAQCPNCHGDRRTTDCHVCHTSGEVVLDLLGAPAAVQNTEEH